MITEQQTCLDHARADLAIGTYRIKASLQRLLGSQEHGPLPPGGIDLREDLEAMLKNAERLDGEFEKLILATQNATAAFADFRKVFPQ